MGHTPTRWARWSRRISRANPGVGSEGRRTVRRTRTPRDCDEPGNGPKISGRKARAGGSLQSVETMKNVQSQAANRWEMMWPPIRACAVGFGRQPPTVDGTDRESTS